MLEIEKEIAYKKDVKMYCPWKGKRMVPGICILSGLTRKRVPYCEIGLTECRFGKIERSAEALQTGTPVCTFPNE